MREADFELIDRFLQGDGTAFDELVRKRQREVYNLAYRMTRNAEGGQALFQSGPTGGFTPRIPQAVALGLR